MAYSSPYPDVSVPEVSLPEFVLAEAPARGDQPALIDGPSGRTVSYAALHHGVRAVATGLKERGFEHGDVLAILLPNCPEYAIAFHGAAWLGVTVTTINPTYNAREIRHQLEHAKAKALITAVPFLPQAKEAGAEQIFVLGEGVEGAEPFAALLAHGADGAGEPAAKPDDIVALPYSSGTTGLSKGVMLTHRNLVANTLQSLAVQEQIPGSRVIGVLPFFHIYGQTVVMNIGLFVGLTIVTVPRFDLEQFLDLVAEHRVRRMHLVPPIILALAKHPIVDTKDVSSLEWINSGAAPLSGELAAACAKRLDCQVVQGYGMTEASPVTHATPEGAAGKHPESIGPPIPNTECKIVDVESGEELGPGKDGELLIRGPQVMVGYLDDPEATRATIDEDGWLHTGDIGHATDEGWFVLVDRLKELIKYKGFQVPPAELEAVILEHESVSDVAVIGVPDDEAGEVPKAFVVTDGSLSEEDLKAFVKERVATYKQVRLVEFIDEIPKSASGKILRRVLKDKEKAAAGE